MSQCDATGDDEPIVLGPDARKKLAEHLAFVHARLRYTPVDYSRMLTGSSLPDLTGADEIPQAAAALVARGQTLVEELERLRDVAEPFDLFGGERKQRQEALAATATVLRAEEYIAAAGEVAAALVKPRNARPELLFETTSCAAHEAATTYFTQELDARSARLAALGDPHAEPVAETSTDRALDVEDRGLLAGLLAQDVQGCRSAIDRVATSRLVDTTIVALLDAVATMSSAFVFGLSLYQRQRDELRRRRAGRRQDRRGEPHPLTGDLINALVVDPRRPHRHRPRRRGHLPSHVVTIADHQPPALLVDLVGVRLDVGSDLGLQRRGQHLPGTVAHDLIEQRPTHRRGDVCVGLGPFVDYLEHRRTFPNQRANAGP